MGNGMKSKIISLKIRDGEPLLVVKTRLTAESRMFRYLIDDLNYSELEMDDFSPEAVNLFITILLEEFQRTILIKHDLFRDTHKLAVVFEVDWIKSDCRNLLREEMKSIKSYEDTRFLFEECYFIFRKWKERNLIDSFISWLTTRQSSLFISKYMSDIRNMEQGKLNILLILGGSNTDLFLEILLKHLEKFKYLGSKAKFLLNKMNLAFCCEQNPEMYLKLFDTISELPEISVSDMRFTHRIRSETARLVNNRKEKKTQTNYIVSERKSNVHLKSCEELLDVVNHFSEGRVPSMYLVVQLLLDFLTGLSRRRLKFINTQALVEDLEDARLIRTFQKVSKEYLDAIISAIRQNSPGRLKSKIALALLSAIRNSDILSTCHENIIIERSAVVEEEGNLTTKEVFTFQHPGSSKACGMAGRCGFILKVHRYEYEFGTDELTVEPKDYEGTSTHYHDIVKAQDMFRYTVMTGKSVDGMKIRAVGRWTKWWKKYFPRSTDWEIEEEFVAYNVADYRVTKCAIETPLPTFQQRLFLESD